MAKDPIASVPAFPSVTQEVADLTLLTLCGLAGRKFHFAEENTVWVVADWIRGSCSRDVPSRDENLRSPVVFHLCFLPKARVPSQVLLDVELSEAAMERRAQHVPQTEGRDHKTSVTVRFSLRDPESCGLLRFSHWMWTSDHL